MSMSLNEFLNYCESINASYINWIIEPVSSKQNWPNKGSGINKGLIIIEEFLLRTEELFDSDIFKSYSNEEVFKYLLELHNIVNKYYSNPDTMFNLMSSEKLLNDKKWIEIQNFGRKVKHNLEIFINKGRENV